MPQDHSITTGRPDFATPAVAHTDVTVWLRRRKWFYERLDEEPDTPGDERDHIPTDIPHKAADLIERLRKDIEALRAELALRSPVNPFRDD